MSQPPPYGPPPAPAAPPPGYYGGGYAQPPVRGTNGFAIASLICAFLCWPLGLIFGIIARNQIKQSGEGGAGLALAGIIISVIALLVTLLYIGAFVAFIHSGSRFPGFYTPPTPT